MACSGLPEKCATVFGLRGIIPNFADLAEPLVALTGKDVPFVGDQLAQLHLLDYATLSFGPRFSLFQLNTEITYWIRMLETSV